MKKLMNVTTTVSALWTHIEFDILTFIFLFPSGHHVWYSYVPMAALRCTAVCHLYSFNPLPDSWVWHNTIL